MSEPATVTRRGAVDMQVCVPEDWTDGLVIEFAEKDNPCGAPCGWQVRTDCRLLAGSPERNPCSDIQGNVHITLDTLTEEQLRST